MNYNMVLNSFLIALIAGLATSIGSIIGLCTKRTNTKFLSYSLGFASGVMIYVSIIEIIPHSKNLMITSVAEYKADMLMIVGFIFGMLLMFLICRFFPDNTDNLSLNHKNKEQQKLYRIGKITAITIAIHNFPEGIATFTTSMTNMSLGIAVAFAIALHNIPEGISVSVPIYYATGNKKRAFLFSFLSGLVEPLGAVIGFIFLIPILNDVVMGSVLAIVAGIMVYISITELMPTAINYGKLSYALIGLILGMIVMFISVVIGGHH